MLSNTSCEKILRTLLVSTTLTSLAFAPVWAETSSAGLVVIAPTQTDDSVINELVSLYRANAATYEPSLRVLRAQRPYLEDRFRKLTSRNKQSVSSGTANSLSDASGQAIRPDSLTVSTQSGKDTNQTGTAALQGNGLFIALGALGLAAAGGGGGGSGGGGENGREPGGPPPLPGTKEYFETSEYFRNAGLSQINASTRYVAGGRGQNVKIGVVDSGIDLQNSEFRGKIDLVNSKSYTADGSLQDQDGHGTHVAGIAAAARDGLGTHGVAFESQLVIYRAIVDEPVPDSSYSDILVSAASAGVRIMNNSWAVVDENGSEYTIADFSNRSELEDFLTSGDPSIFAAMNTAKNANILSVFAAGNESLSDAAVYGAIPVFLPEYSGYVLAAVAVNDQNVIADFSNRCGLAKDHCLAAPGVRIESTLLGGSGQNNVVSESGTSMAAPHISGAAALLLSQWPELDAPTLSRLLLDTATDLGAPGVDDVYGHGLLNVANAMKPAGNLVIYNGTSVSDAATPLADSAIVASGAMNGALKAALSAREMIVGDRYNRAFAMDMDTLLVSSGDSPKAKLMMETSGAAGSVRVASLGGQGTAYGVVADDFSTWFGTSDAVALSSGTLDHSTLLDGGTTAQFGLSLQSGWDARMAATFDDDGWGSGDAFSIGVYGSGPLRASFGFGQLNEEGQVLGTSFLGASGRNASALTNFVSFGAGATLGGTVDIDIQAVVGRTDFTQQGLVAGGNDMVSTGAMLSISRSASWIKGGRIGFNVEMPITVTQGTLTIDAPVQRSAAVNGVASSSVIRSREDIDFQNSDQPVDVGMSFTVPIDDSRMFGLQLEGGYRLSTADSPQAFAGFAFTRKF